MPGRVADFDSAHPCLVLDVFDGIPDLGLGLLLLTGQAISLVARDVANRFLGLALEILGVGLEAAGGGGEGHEWGAEGEGP